MKKVLALLAFAPFTLTLVGNTVLPSVISSNTTLTKSKSPYTIVSDLTVNTGIQLIIEPGVVVKLAKGITVNVRGMIRVNGSEQDSIYFQSLNNGEKWDIINTYNASAFFNYTVVTGGVRFISASGGDSIVISHCRIESPALGNGEDCIAAHDTKVVSISFIDLKGAGGKIANGIKNDAIDLDACDSCSITNCRIYNFGDDGIDIGTQTKVAVIHDNIIHNCNYGVTVGESSTAYLKNIIAYANDGGIQTHNHAVVYADNCTFYANTDGVECYHSEEGEAKLTGGTLIMTNTIFYGTKRYEITKQSNSSITIGYSISDKETLPGNDNLFGDPLLNDPVKSDFRLKQGSPCIDAGFSSDQSKINIGAVQEIVEVSVIINNSSCSLRVYPNPASIQVKVEINNIQANIPVAIFDYSGRKLAQQNTLSGVCEFNLQGFKPGLYLIKTDQLGQSVPLVIK